MNRELESILEACRIAVEDPDYPGLQDWKKANPDGLVLGHFQVYFPEEIAHAAGMLPL